MARKRRDETPEYKEFVSAVLKRDKHTCQMPGCNCRYRKKLEVHHIIRYADSVNLRHEVGNGITLCKKCHYEIRNKEKHFIEMFMRIINDK